METKLIIILSLIFFSLNHADENIWYQNQIKKNIDVDESLEIFSVIAKGNSATKLKIEFKILKNGKAIHSATWNSIDYFQYEMNISSLTEEELSKHVRNQLIELLNVENFAFFDFKSEPTNWVPDYPDGSARDMICYEMGYDCLNNKSDTTKIVKVWNNLKITNPITFTYFLGGEHTKQIIWSELLKKFVTIWSCC